MTKKKLDTMGRIREALHKANLTHVHQATGLTIQQVRNIRDGVSTDPRWSTVQKLAEHLDLAIG